MTKMNTSDAARWRARRDEPTIAEDDWALKLVSAGEEALKFSYVAYFESDVWVTDVAKLAIAAP